MTYIAPVSRRPHAGRQDRVGGAGEGSVQRRPGGVQRGGLYRRRALAGVARYAGGAARAESRGHGAGPSMKPGASRTRVSGPRSATRRYGPLCRIRPNPHRPGRPPQAVCWRQARPAICAERWRAIGGSTDTFWITSPIVSQQVFNRILRSWVRTVEICTP